jgi:hypothetical protein
VEAGKNTKLVTEFAEPLMGSLMKLVEKELTYMEKQIKKDVHHGH